MNNKRAYTFKPSDLMYYFVIISFLHPRGLSEYYETYKLFFTGCIWISTFIIYIQYLVALFKGKIKYDFRKFFIANYFFIAIILTFFVRKGLSTGLQQLFTFPAICIFIIYNMQKRPERILNVINNVCLILFIFNQFLYRDFFSQQYHIVFLGHVQAISQLGLLSIFTSIFYWLFFHQHKWRMYFTILITIFTMLTTDADSAILSILMLIVFGIIYKWKFYHLLKHNTYFYLISGFILSVFIIIVTTFRNTVSFLTFSGRNFIWRDAIFKIKASPLYGYGIDGILIDVFWNSWAGSEGFNYAHNQIIQNFLDGGLILCIAFWLMLAAFCTKSNKIEDQKYKILINASLIVLLFIMIFDSTTLYCYMFVLLSMVFVIPDLIQKKYT